jgi:hypothetical protein
LPDVTSRIFSILGLDIDSANQKSIYSGFASRLRPKADFGGQEASEGKSCEARSAKQDGGR